MGAGRCSRACCCCWLARRSPGRCATTPAYSVCPRGISLDTNCSHGCLSPRIFPVAGLFKPCLPCAARTELRGEEAPRDPDRCYRCRVFELSGDSPPLAADCRSDWWGFFPKDLPLRLPNERPLLPLLPGEGMPPFRTTRRAHRASSWLRARLLPTSEAASPPLFSLGMSSHGMLAYQLPFVWSVFGMTGASSGEALPLASVVHVCKSLSLPTPSHHTISRRYLLLECSSLCLDVYILYSIVLL